MENFNYKFSRTPDSYRLGPMNWEFCEIKVKEDGVYIICKNYGYNRKYFQIKLDENLIFQKLTEQELVLLSALDHLSK